jgi:hypothetical protein
MLAHRGGRRRSVCSGDGQGQPARDRVGILRPLRVRDFAFLWIGLTVSFIGDGIYIVAIAWQTYDLSNSPSALAAVGIAWSLPQVVLILITGVLSDRVDRRLLMIAGDVIRGVAIATIGIMSIGGTLTMTSLISLVVVYGVGQALFGPAFSSIVPQVVPEDLLVEANSLGQFRSADLVDPDRAARRWGARRGLRHRMGVRRRRGHLRVLGGDGGADADAAPGPRRGRTHVAVGRPEGGASATCGGRPGSGSGW